AYGRAKLMLEHCVLQSLSDAVVIRVANAYGPGQPAARGQGVVAHWLGALSRDESVIVYGDPTTSRDYIYVGDVASALLIAARVDGKLPPILNVGSGRATSLADLLHHVIRVVDKERVQVEYALSRGFDVSANWLDVSLANNILDWSPSIELH